MRQVVLYVATSVDGYIAREDGSVDWLEAMGEAPDLTEAYERFLSGVDDLVMGRTTYDQVVGFGAWPYAGKRTHVLTRRDADPHDGVAFTNEAPRALVTRLRGSDGGGIWLVGGTDVAMQFEAAGLIDAYRISVVPVRLGAGIPLFRSGGPEHRLRCLGSRTIGPVIELRYERT